MKKELNNNRAEEILNSFDGIQPSELPPYFYTRLKAKMQREHDEKSLPVFFLRPAFLTVSLTLVLIMNIVFLMKTASEKIPAADKSNAVTGIRSFADAYGLSSSVLYE